MDGDKLLLIRAKRGVSFGKWNGPGGKMEPGETPEQCVIRETLEETGLIIKNPFYHGLMNFYDFGNEEVFYAVHLFSAKEFSGKLKETEEGELRWFPVNALPMSEMWPDDEYWMPHLLKRERFDYDFYFNEDRKKIIKHEIKPR